MPGFQTTVNLQPAPAIAGDFASANPRTSVLAGPGAIVADVGGVVVGRFAWLDDATFSKASNAGYGLPDGFVARSMNALITTFLAETSLVIPQGNIVTLFNEGEFWVVNSGTNIVIPNLKAYANNATGLITFGATGSPPSDFSHTASIAAAPGSATTSTITDNLFTVQTLASGNFYVGSTLTGTGVATGTIITAQLTGPFGGATGSTFLVSIPNQAVTSTTITGAAGLMTSTAATTGTIKVGDTLVAGGGGGANVVANTHVTALGTGSGGTGTYVVDNNTVVTSGVIAGTGGIETKWVSGSFASAGELVKMSSWPRG